ncbi:MAG: 2-oxo acid dehydrogenase subunit E2 [Ferrimicrobium sp.]
MLSPVVRRIIVQNNLDPSEIRGTGVGGRITRSDVLAVLDQRAAQGRLQSETAPVPPAPTPQAILDTTSEPTLAQAPVSSSEVALRSSEITSFDAVMGSRDYLVPFTNIRRRTAQHMMESKSISAHTLMSIEVDFERVERVRRARGAAFKAEEGFALTYLPFIARATIEAIRAYPNINASVLGDSLVVHRDVHLSIAVDLNLGGLIAPVVHGADGRRLQGIAREIHDLATRARSKKLSADDIAGGTFTITNPGPFGTFMTGAIINQPQVAILATDGIARKPVVVVDEEGTESIGVHSVGMLTLNFDHRAIDGAYAAAFLAKEKQVLESWNWEQEF